MQRIQIPIWVTFLLLLGTLFAQGKSKPAENIKDTVIKLERSGCKEKCPVYSVEIHGDGTVIYQGHDFVRVKKKVVYKIPLDFVKSLIAEFYKADFFVLNDKYAAIQENLPTYTLSFSSGDKDKTVLDELSGPGILKELQDAVDETVHIQKWIFFNLDQLKEELKDGLDLKQESHALLLKAVKWNHPEIIQLLLNSGADVNVDESIEGIHKPTSALTYAIKLHRTSCVKKLLEGGAHISARDFIEYIAIDQAAEEGDPEIVRLLIQYHADVNHENGWGETPLMKAASYGFSEIVQVLIDAGADINHKSEEGTSLSLINIVLESQKISHDNEGRTFPEKDIRNKFVDFDKTIAILKAAGAKEN